MIKATTNLYFNVKINFLIIALLSFVSKYDTKILIQETEDVNEVKKILRAYGVSDNGKRISDSLDGKTGRIFGEEICRLLGKRNNDHYTNVWLEKVRIPESLTPYLVWDAVQCISLTGERIGVTNGPEESYFYIGSISVPRGSRGPIKKMDLKRIVKLDINEKDYKKIELAVTSISNEADDMFRMIGELPLTDKNGIKNPDHICHASNKIRREICFKILKQLERGLLTFNPAIDQKDNKCVDMEIARYRFFPGQTEYTMHKMMECWYLGQESKKQEKIVIVNASKSEFYFVAQKAAPSTKSVVKTSNALDTSKFKASASTIYPYKIFNCLLAKSIFRSLALTREDENRVHNIARSSKDYCKFDYE